MQKVCFCDLETSGLNPVYSEVLEVAMVKFEDGEIDLKRALHFYVDHPRITYDLQALKKFGDRIKDRKPDIPVYTPSEADGHIRQFMIYQMNAGTGVKATMGGKNFGSFDLPFLKRLSTDFDKFIYHRHVDLGNLYMARGDFQLPDLETCRQRALSSGVRGTYIHDTVNHTALDDAVLCAELYKGYYDGQLGDPGNPAWRKPV